MFAVTFTASVARVRRLRPCGVERGEPLQLLVERARLRAQRFERLTRALQFTRQLRLAFRFGAQGRRARARVAQLA